MNFLYFFFVVIIYDRWDGMGWDVMAMNNLFIFFFNFNFKIKNKTLIINQFNV